MKLLLRGGKVDIALFFLVCVKAVAAQILI